MDGSAGKGEEYQAVEFIGNDNFCYNFCLLSLLKL